MRLKSLLRFRSDEGGTVNFDFVIMLPAFLVIFISAYESALLMTRQVMLDRGIDLAVRSIQINTANPPTYEQVKIMICNGAGLIPDCENDLKLELDLQDPFSFINADPSPDCVDRALTVNPAGSYDATVDNSLMIMRACVKFSPIFPTAGLGFHIKNSSGEYALVSTTAFASEPAG